MLAELRVLIRIFGIIATIKVIIGAAKVVYSKFIRNCNMLITQ